MAIQACISLSNQQAPNSIDETGTHGTPEFPVAIYLDDVTTNIVNWHWHAEFEIGYIETGSVLFQCGNRKYQLAAGDLFFANSNVLHAMGNMTPGQTAVFKSIAFDASLISSSAESVFYKRYLYPVMHNAGLRDSVWTKDSVDYERLFGIVRNTWNSIYEEPADYEITVRNLLSEVFAILIHVDNTAVTDAFAANLIQENRVQVILNYIHSNYEKPITLDDLAAVTNVSKSEVLRCFKSIIGISPIKYLKNHRLQNAAYMLKNTAYSIQTIYELCGFEDNSYFSKSFKEIYHCSPREYRGM